MKKYKTIIALILCVFMFNFPVYASVIQTVNSNSDNSIINEDIKFTKKIVNYNAETKEIEIELSIKNMKKNKNGKEDIEVIVVLDNSSSMKEEENNETRKTTTYNSAKKFIDLIYNNISRLKLSVMQFSNDVSVLTNLTSSKQEALNGVEVYYNLVLGGSTNTHSALDTAKSQFSSNCKNKVVILLTDGFPSNSNETKKALENLSQEGIFVLSLIVGQEEDGTIQSVFGTEENPTVGKVYYIKNNSEIDKIFNKFMYQEILNYMEHPITDISIEDVFPKTLLKYFDIEYENIKNGTVTSIGNNNSFTWDIDKLTGEETATFRYKIKVKENVNVSEIIGTELKTNDGVIVKYKNEDGEEKKKVLDKNPSIVVKNESGDSEDKSEENEFVIVDFTPQEKENQNTNQINKVNTKPSAYTEKLPQTGLEDLPVLILVGSILIAIGFGIRWVVIERIAKGK